VITSNASVTYRDPTVNTPRFLPQAEDDCLSCIVQTRLPGPMSHVVDLELCVEDDGAAAESLSPYHTSQPRPKGEVLL